MKLLAVHSSPSSCCFHSLGPTYSHNPVPKHTQSVMFSHSADITGAKLKVPATVLDSPSHLSCPVAPLSLSKVFVHTLSLTESELPSG